MLLDQDITSCSRQCFVSGRAFAGSETYYSELVVENGATVRRDIAAAEWRGPSPGAIAWWRARMPQGDGDKPKLAPHDVLLNLFAELAERSDEAEFRYLLGLLLIRRRLVKLEETRREAQGEVMVLDCPRRNEQYQLRVAAPSADRTDELQRRMVELLYGGE